MAFPEKTLKEKQKITKKFYRNFTDTIFETIKLMSAGKNLIRSHFAVDFSIVDELYARGKKCQLHLGHNFNWELANLAIPLGSPYVFIDIYLPLGSKIFDRLLLYIRSRTGTVLIPVNNVRKVMVQYRNQPYLLSLVADQNPGNPSKALWLNFFGRPAPFMPGPENIARRNNTPVVFCHFTKIRRGYYQGHSVLATEDPVSLPPGELTRMYVSYLENVIRNNPDMWLWSHRRWKHEWKEEYGKVI